MQTFILRTIDHSGEAHNSILGAWYAAIKPGNPAYERIEKANPFNLEEGDGILCIVRSAQVNETFLFKKSTAAAYVMIDNGSTFECLFSFI